MANSIERQNIRDAKVDELLVKVNRILELIEEEITEDKEAKKVIKKKKGAK